jgi:hypothetical protein
VPHPRRVGACIAASLPGAAASMVAVVHMFEQVGGVPMARARGIHPLSRPIVATVERCAEMLKLEPGRLAEAVARARLPVWGHHADGSEVFAWGPLAQLAQQLGGQLPPELGHPHRQYAAARRGRQNRARQGGKPSS